MMTDSALDPRALKELEQTLEGLPPDTMAQLFELFIQEVPHRRRMMRDALAASDTEALRRAGHAIAGSSGSIAASCLEEKSRQLEEDEWDDAAPLVKAIEAEIDRVVAEMKIRIAQIRAAG